MRNNMAQNYPLHLMCAHSTLQCSEQKIVTKLVVSRTVNKTVRDVRMRISCEVDSIKPRC